MNNIEKLCLINSALSFMINFETMHDDRIANIIINAFKDKDKSAIEKLSLEYHDKINKGIWND